MEEKTVINKKIWLRILAAVPVLGIAAAGCASSEESGSNKPKTGVIYHVSAVNGNDSNSGTGNAPFKTIVKAASMVKPGDTVVVKQGEYKELVEITTSGTENAWITFKANPGDKVYIIKPSDMWGGYGGSFDIKADYIHIEGFELTGLGLGSGVTVNGQALGKNLHHIRIFNNNIHDCGGSGINVSRGDYLHIKGNTVYRNAFSADYQGSGISIWEGWAFDNNKDFHNIIENNICFDNYNKTPDPKVNKTTDGNGIIVDYHRNTNSSALVQNNICFNNGGRGIQITASVNVTVVNNTLYMNSWDVNIPGGEFGNSTSEASKNSNIVFQNNICYARKDKPCLSIWRDDSSCEYDYNLYFNEGIIYNNGSGSEVSPENYGLHGSNNILNDDPMFVKIYLIKNMDSSILDRYDFSLQPASPCINKGTKSLAPEADILGNKRSNADIGAISFNGLHAP